MKDMNSLKEAQKSSSFNLNIDGIPESTKEGFLNPSANLLGQAFRGIVHAVFDPLVKFNIIRDQELEDFEEKVKLGTDKIPEENRDDSKIGLVLKAFEESKYQLNSDELRELFANLISSTVDNRKNDKVQPSFASVLRDLSTTDAQLVKLFAKENTVPLVSIRVEDKNGIGVGLDNNILLFDNEMVLNELSLFSLERLGILSIEFNSTLQSKKNQAKYQDFENTSMYISRKQSLPLESGEFTFEKIKLKKGSAEVTPFGEAFLSCIV